MNPYIIRQRLWQLIPRMNPQPAMYLSRVVNQEPTPEGQDTQTIYYLLQVTYRDLNRDELAMAGATLEDTHYVFTIYQPDLDQSGGPIPKISYELSFNVGPFAGTTWTVQRVTPLVEVQAFECLCRQARPQ